ncbi:MAG: hypothetical protein LWW86_03720 [Micrococcales bacterium]|nr:hypothetical protein [Micrococcales bacterium]
MHATATAPQTATDGPATGSPAILVAGLSYLLVRTVFGWSGDGFFIGTMRAAFGDAEWQWSYAAQLALFVVSCAALDALWRRVRRPRSGESAG